MAKAYALHRIDLKPGVKEADFERFIQEEVYQVPDPFPGVTRSLVKLERGDGVGQYLWLFEFDSLEALDRFAPRPGQSPSEETRRWYESYKEVWAEWQRLSSFPGDDYIGDYIVIGD